ncbi:MAG TPA: AMP-binding protein [Chloroflexia bacterium]|nr:AMP-binding protein [Chloroflexia bacterium]
MGFKSDRAVWEAESGDFELVDMTIGDMLDRQALAFPDKEALVYNYPEMGLNLRQTYPQFRDEANRVAKGLLALGIARGEHVAVWGPNLPQWLYLQMGLAKIGAVLVTVNPAYRVQELEYVLRQADVTTLFMVEEVRGNSFLQSVYQLAPELKSISDPGKEELKSAVLPALKRVGLMSDTPQPGLLTFSQLLELGNAISDEALAARQASVTPRDTTIIMYTSGTTGFPKGAMLSHYSVLNAARLCAYRYRLQPEDRLVSPMPLFHIAGITSCSLVCFVAGSTLIQLVGFDPAKLLELVQQEKATMTGGVPTMLIAILNHPRFVAGEFDTSSLRWIYSGAASVPVILMEQIREKMGAECGVMLGQTENSGIVTMPYPDDSFEIRASTVGLPLEYNDLKVVNTGSGEPVGFGEIGELMTRGFMVMQGYYKMPEKTTEAIDAEGWFHTGDLATMNAQGYINIVGRVKEMVIRGGENIYPAEIEAFLLRYPALADAQILGVPDALMGEELVALLKLKPGAEATEDEIREYCRANLSRYKVPKYIKFVTDYPLTASGKVKKFELRQQLIDELGLQEAAKIKTA